jgi:hypothetical protein
VKRKYFCFCQPPCYCFLGPKWGRPKTYITSSVRGEQPSQLSSIMPPHSSSRLQLMPPTQNSSSSTSLVQMRANTHVSSSVTDVVDILDVNFGSFPKTTSTDFMVEKPNYNSMWCYITIHYQNKYINKTIKMLTISKNLVWPRDLEGMLRKTLALWAYQSRKPTTNL